VDATLPPLELQDALQRFTTQFTDRVTQSMEALELSSEAAIRDEALRKNLLYVSSALEIASGLDPQINLLDMIVFIHLSRAVLEKHWIPALYREKGTGVAEVFTKSEQELQALAEQALTLAQSTQLMNVVDTWLAENPHQIRVEGIRLADFARISGRAAAERAMQTKGLLSASRRHRAPRTRYCCTADEMRVALVARARGARHGCPGVPLTNGRWLTRSPGSNPAILANTVWDLRTSLVPRSHGTPTEQESLRVAPEALFPSRDGLDPAGIRT